MLIYVILINIIVIKNFTMVKMKNVVIIVKPEEFILSLIRVDWSFFG